MDLSTILFLLDAAAYNARMSEEKKMTVEYAVSKETLDTMPST